MSRSIDITGQHFGFLTAFERVSSRRSGRNHYDSIWLFRCECGTEKEIKLSAVRSGGTYSCGCWRNDLLRQRHQFADEVRK